MISITPGPISTKWTSPELDTAGPATRTPATAAAIAQAVGSRQLPELAGWHRELAAVVADLAVRTGSPWPFGHDDPTVALMRALSRFAVAHPDTTSELGSQLLDALTAAPHSR